MMDDRHKDAEEQHLAMVQLQKSDGWTRLVKLVEEQIHARRQTFYAPCAGMDGVIAQEFTKGEIATFELVKLLPERMVVEALDVIDVYERQAELDSAQKEEQDAA